MIAKLLLQNLIWIVAMGALLLVPAGTLHWRAAWAFLATIGPLGIAGMYTGTVLFFAGAALLLGSWWGVVLSPLFAVLFAIRSRIEERALLAGLHDYADYTARVRYRLVPGMW